MSVDIQEIDNYLESEERVGALRHIIREVLSQPSFSRWTKRKRIFSSGKVFYDVNFYFGKRYYFAIIPNKKWLLWYFRIPALKAFSYNVHSLKEDFPPDWINGTLYEKVSENNAGEIKVRLFDIRDARLLTQKYLR